MIENALNDYKGFNFEDAMVHLWVFKISQNKENKKIPNYNGSWVRIGEHLRAELKNIMLSEKNRVTELHDYSLLVQNNENSALHVSKELTHADMLIASCAEETEKKRVKKVEKLKNSFFYVVKYVHEGNIVYGVKKTPSGWAIQKRKGFVSINYSDQAVELCGDDAFEIAKTFDMVIMNNSIFALHKNNFESVMKYKNAHVENFSELKDEPDFAALFTDMSAIERYVGDNKTQLRRVAAIKQKGYYQDGAFIQSLKDNLEKLRLNIRFDEEGKIIPCDQTCRDIFQALLDHRLLSHYQDKAYDVQDAVDAANATVGA